MEFLTKMPTIHLVILGLCLLAIIVIIKNISNSSSHSSHSNHLIIDDNGLSINGHKFEIDGKADNIKAVNGIIISAVITKNGEQIGEIKNNEVIYFDQENKE